MYKIENLPDLIMYPWEQYGSEPKGLNRFDMEDFQKVIEKIKKSDNMIFCDIGTNMGTSAAIMGFYAKKYGGKVYTIDPFIEEPKIKNIFFKHRKNLGLDKYIKFLHTTSLKAAEKLKDIKFDLIYIDGSHLYANVKNDIEVWYPKIKKGGIICGHDCSIIADKNGNINLNKYKNHSHETTGKDTISIWVGVTLAVSEKFGDKANIEGSRTWWRQKNGKY